MTTLSDDQIAEMRRQRVGEGTCLAALAAEYDISVGYVSMLVRGEKRTDAGGPLETGETKPPSFEGGTHSDLSDADVAAIRYECRDSDVSQLAIAREYGVSESTVSRLARGVDRADAPGPIRGEDYEEV